MCTLVHVGGRVNLDFNGMFCYIKRIWYCSDINETYRFWVRCPLNQ